VKVPVLDQASALAILVDLAEHNDLLAKTTDADRVRLCVETGGNPLLLRWVAGQLGRGSCRTIADALRFLRACPRENDPLEFIFGDLADQFGDAESQTLMALSYFAQPATAEHVADVAGLDLEIAKTTLNTLANQSLVVPDPQDRLFAALPMVAEFVRRRMPGLRAATDGRLEERAFQRIVENGGKHRDRFRLLDAAWPATAPALTLFVNGPNERLQVVCDALVEFLNYTGRWDERIGLSRQAEEKAVASGDLTKAGWRAVQEGMTRFNRGQAAEVLDCARRATAHWEAAGAGPRERAIALRLEGTGHELTKRHAAAIKAYKAAGKILRKHSKRSVDLAIVLCDLADAEQLSGNFATAERHYKQALRVVRKAQHEEMIAGIPGNLAELAAAARQWAKAERLARAALPLTEHLGRQELIARDLRVLAQALVRRGKALEAVPYAQRAVEIWEKLGSPEAETARNVLREAQRLRPARVQHGKTP
jgi:tetratricopeptide (TPR) repeat protein